MGDSHDSPPSLARPISQLCTQSQFAEPEYGYWRELIREQPIHHRKIWEFVYILQALDHAGVMIPGARGLGFGVGREPLAAALAARGCRVVATDMDPERSAAAGWIESSQHAAGLEQLNDRAICPPGEFAERVDFRVVDMNEVPHDLTGFDFVWSSCSLEHLGSLDHGLRFIHRSLDCLRPGGLAVHTTEYNVSSEDKTLDAGVTVLYRRRDIEALVDTLRAAGHDVALNLNPGDGELDHYIDRPPYDLSTHLKLQLGEFVTTSIGIIIRKAS
jgi:SAM-dependent methyltransferase